MSISEVRSNGTRNKLLPGDRAAHDWYRFVLSFPPHLVRDYLDKLGASPKTCVLDPFCGTGTTIVECKKLGIPSVGIEANPMAAFASRVKVDWSPSPSGLKTHAQATAEQVREIFAGEGISDDDFFSSPGKKPASLRTLPAEKMHLLLKDSISPLPLHKTLTLLAVLEERTDDRYAGHEKLALAKALIESVGNLHFGPEVGVEKPKADAAVLWSWLDRVERMAADLKLLKSCAAVPARVLEADSREVDGLLAPASVDVVITSPPYPNEKDYTRTTRLESVLLGFIRDKKGLRAMKEGLIRSNTRNVYVDDVDDRWVRDNRKIQKIAEDIEARRIAMGKDSGFERQYHRVAKLYFGGMARHFARLRTVLKRGARLAYVVGDQASYLRVMIRTGTLLAEIAESLGYEVVNIDLFRTRLATATKEQLREEVLLLRWPGEPR
jgi:DNA modification methylase